MDEYYRILGLKKDATRKELKEAYYKMAKEYHPDGKGEQAGNAHMFKLVNEAYSELSRVIKNTPVDAKPKETKPNGGAKNGEGKPAKARTDTSRAKKHLHIDPKYFATLKLEPGASNQEVEEAYSALRAEYHQQPFKMAQIDQAYRELKRHDLD